MPIEIPEISSPVPFCDGFVQDNVADKAPLLPGVTVNPVTDLGPFWFMIVTSSSPKA